MRLGWSKPIMMTPDKCPIKTTSDLSETFRNFQSFKDLKHYKLISDYSISICDFHMNSRNIKSVHKKKSESSIKYG